MIDKKSNQRFYFLSTSIKSNIIQKDLKMAILRLYQKYEYVKIGRQDKLYAVEQGAAGTQHKINC